MGKKQLTALVLLVITAIGGLIFSGLLLFSSAQVAAGIGGPSICQIGESLDCTPALSSKYASLLGIPLPVLSGAFYFAVLALAGTVLMSRVDREARATTAARFLVVTFGVALIFTAVLGWVTATQLQAACPFCIGLYIASGLGFVASWMLGPRFREADGPVDALQSMVISRPVMSALIVFVVAALVSLIMYHRFVTQATAQNEQEQAAAGQRAAQKLQLQGPVEFDLSELPRLGPENAPIKIVEFSDFECPYCARFSKTLHEVHKAYPDTVAIYFSHFPIDSACNPMAGRLHPSACYAAQAALCAHDAEDKFWEVHDALFEHFDEVRAGDDPRAGLSESKLLSIAERVKLRRESFLSCVDDEFTRNRVTMQIARAHKIGVKSTPTWLINGNLQEGAGSFAYMQPLIEHLLRLHRDSQATGAAAPAPSTATDP